MRQVIAALVAIVLAGHVGAEEWQRFEDHTPMVLESGKSIPRSEYALERSIDVPNQSGVADRLSARLRCQVGIVPDFTMRIEIPLAATAFAGREAEIEGNAYRLNVSARLSGGDARPVIVHQQGVFSFETQVETIWVTLGRFGLYGATLSGEDIRAALVHLTSEAPELSLIMGHSVKRRSAWYRGRIALAGVAEPFKAHLVENCPGIESIKGEVARPESVTDVATRPVRWFEFESTRFTAAQRTQFETVAKQTLKDAEALSCSYAGEGGGVQVYEFWLGQVPEGVADLISAGGRDTRGAALGRMAVNRCPETAELAALVRFHGWP